MRKINNVTRPVSRDELQTGDIVEFGSCTSEWIIHAIEGEWLMLEQIKGTQIGWTTHTTSPVQLVEPR